MATLDQNVINIISHYFKNSNCMIFLMATFPKTYVIYIWGGNVTKYALTPNLFK